MDELYTIMPCKEQIIAANLAIHTPFQTIKTLYQSKEIAEVDYSTKKEKRIMLEIRFVDATLSLLFDNRNICNSAHLFLDDPDNFTHYLDFCSKTFQYNHALKGWINDGCITQVYIEDNECNFMVLPIESVGF